VLTSGCKVDSLYAFCDLLGLLGQHELIAHLSRRPVVALNDARKQCRRTAYSILDSSWTHSPRKNDKCLIYMALPTGAWLGQKV
jgi:hypothetical protein